MLMILILSFSWVYNFFLKRKSTILKRNIIYMIKYSQNNSSFYIYFSDDIIFSSRFIFLFSSNFHPSSCFLFSLHIQRVHLCLSLPLSLAQKETVNLSASHKQTEYLPFRLDGAVTVRCYFHFLFRKPFVAFEFRWYVLWFCV